MTKHMILWGNWSVSSRKSCVWLDRMPVALGADVGSDGYKIVAEVRNIYIFGPL